MCLILLCHNRFRFYPTWFSTALSSNPHMNYHQFSPIRFAIDPSARNCHQQLQILCILYYRPQTHEYNQFHLFQTAMFSIIFNWFHISNSMSKYSTPALQLIQNSNETSLQKDRNYYVPMQYTYTTTWCNILVCVCKSLWLHSLFKQST